MLMDANSGPPLTCACLECGMQTASEPEKRLQLTSDMRATLFIRWKMRSHLQLCLEQELEGSIFISVWGHNMNWIVICNSTDGHISDMQCTAFYPVGLGQKHCYIRHREASFPPHLVDGIDSWEKYTDGRVGMDGGPWWPKYTARMDLCCGPSMWSQWYSWCRV